jgi:hypothetical protein
MVTDNRGSVDESARLRAWRPIVRYWWVIATASLIGAVVGFAIAQARAPLYEARAVVIGSDSPIQSDSFGSLAKLLFATDAVIQPVVDSLGLDTTVRSLLANDRLEVEEVPRTVAVWVIGRSQDPEVASELANTAADSFASVGTERGMGTLEVFDPAAVPTSKPSTQTVATVVAGALVGGSLGLAATLLFIFLTRPVLSRVEALRAFPAPASFSVKVPAPILSRLKRRTTTRQRGTPKVVTAIWRATGDDTGSSPSVLCCRVDRPGLPKRATREFLARLAPERGDSNSFRCLTAKDNGLFQALRESNALIAVVSAGASAHALHRLHEDTASLHKGHRRVLVFVR